MARCRFGLICSEDIAVTTVKMKDEMARESEKCLFAELRTYDIALVSITTEFKGRSSTGWVGFNTGRKGSCVGDRLAADRSFMMPCKSGVEPAGSREAALNNSVEKGASASKPRSRGAGCFVDRLRGTNGADATPAVTLITANYEQLSLQLFIV